MPLASGTRLGPKGPMPFEDAWKIASQMARGLEYAHDKGVVHRDRSGMKDTHLASRDPAPNPL